MAGAIPSGSELNAETFRSWMVAAVAQAQPTELVESTVALVAQLLVQLAEVNAKLAAELSARYKRRTERISAEQLSLLQALLGGEETAPTSANDDGGDDTNDGDDDDTLTAIEKELRAAEAARERAKAARKKDKPRRKALPANLPRTVVHHDLEAEDHLCDGCGKCMTPIGTDVREVLELIPAKLVVKQHRLPIVACRTCKDQVVTANAPPRPVPGGQVGASVLAHTVCSKIIEHMPLYRLARRYRRAGWTAPSSTLSDHMAQVAGLLRPLWQRIDSKVNASHLLQLDGSGLKVQDSDVSGNIRRGTMWCTVGDRRWVAFHYAPTGQGNDGPWKLLAGRQGYLQADAANSFDRLYNGMVANATEVGCWAHARRRFFKLKDSDPRVVTPLRLIAMMYRLERMADDYGYDIVERQQMRETKTRRVLKALYSWIVKTSAREPPTSRLGKACAYALNHRTALQRFVEDGRLPLDNNFCEGRIRGLALGRKNYLFAGSDAAAENLAILYSVLNTAVIQNVEPFEYLTDVLRRLSKPIASAELDALLPDAWLEARTERYETSAEEAA